jgi:hypothetical protein
MDLDVLTPDHVAGHAVLDADLGVGGRHLLVISGIALPAWEIDDEHVHREECRLRLRVPAGAMEQATVHTGLASISNDDSEYVFATDQSRLEVDEAGELVLVTNLALMGESSALNRFSYQIVLTTRIVVSEISGTITWPTGWFRPASATPTAVAGTFTVVANERTTTQGGGPLGGVIEHLVPVTPGQIVTVEIGDQECRARYRISDPPKGRELKVTIAQQGFQLPGLGQIFIVPVVSPGGDLVTLSVAQPSRDGVDFRASWVEGPH